jgi:hypothetical protein
MKCSTRLAQCDPCLLLYLLRITLICIFFSFSGLLRWKLILRLSWIVYKNLEPTRRLLESQLAVTVSIKVLIITQFVSVFCYIRNKNDVYKFGILFLFNPHCVILCSRFHPEYFLIYSGKITRYSTKTSGLAWFLMRVCALNLE